MAGDGERKSPTFGGGGRGGGRRETVKEGTNIRRIEIAQTKKFGEGGGETQTKRILKSQKSQFGNEFF